jgi:uncharacterized phage protein (TIGR01671 family)
MKMREIKFRAWHKTAKKMCGVSQLDMWNPDQKQTEVYELATGNHYGLFGKVDRKDIELMQYTGLKDKNGKEIYEGDICEDKSEIFTNWGRTPTGKYDISYCEILWVGDGWGKKWIKSNSKVLGSTLSGLCAITKFLTVVGNIYENPDFREAKDES